MDSSYGRRLRGVAASPPSSRARRALLITGTPGTGKRTIAAFLAIEWGFEHVDLTEPARQRRALERMLTLAERGALGYLVVTCAQTWPTDCFDLLYALEIEWVWLDGDRGALRPQPFALIDPTGQWMTINAPRFVDPFDRDGLFRPLEAVVADVLDPDHDAARAPLEPIAALRRETLG